MEIIGPILVLVVLAMAVLQWWMKRRARALEGQAAPQVEGEPPAAGRRLYYFFSPSCGPCRRMSPVIDALRAADRDVVSVDVSQDLEIARKFGVMGTPTLVLVDAGQVAKVLVGAQSEAQINALLTN
jgi:thioredoxin 1